MGIGSDKTCSGDPQLQIHSKIHLLINKGAMRSEDSTDIVAKSMITEDFKQFSERLVRILEGVILYE